MDNPDIDIPWDLPSDVHIVVKRGGREKRNVKSP
jgi:hypothetical protein